MGRVARQIHTTLLVEARGILAAMRADPVTPTDWERCERQWVALLKCARQGTRTALGETPADESAFLVPVHKQGLRDLAEELGLDVLPFEPYTPLKERVIDELRLRAETEGR